MIITRIVQAVLVVGAVGGMVHMVKGIRRGGLLVVFMTARLVLSMPWSDIPLYEAGQTSAPACLSSYDCPEVAR